MRQSIARTIGTEMTRLKRRDCERGASIVSFVVLAPAFVLMILVLAQVMIAGHVRHVASLAAATGVAEAATWDGSAASGHQRADAQLAGASGWVLSPIVSSSRNATTATVTVEADAFRILPFGDWHIEVQRTAPVEVINP